mgnify:CR=1 FL=1
MLCYETNYLCCFLLTLFSNHVSDGTRVTEACTTVLNTCTDCHAFCNGTVCDCEEGFYWNGTHCGILIYTLYLKANWNILKKKITHNCFHLLWIRFRTAHIDMLANLTYKQFYNEIWKLLSAIAANHSSFYTFLQLDLNYVKNVLMILTRVHQNLCVALTLADVNVHQHSLYSSTESAVSLFLHYSEYVHWNYEELCPVATKPMIQ